MLKMANTRPQRRRRLLLVAFLLVTLIAAVESSRPAFACGGPEAAGMRFCNRDLPIKVRVRDLIGRLETEEKIRLLVNNAAPVPRLGIGGYEWWSEALHGISDTGPGVKFGGDFPGATSFPQVILAAASFNASLWERIGRVVSDEGRAMYNGGRAGLTFWSPNVNIYRDPRWGRGQETPGEDPILAGKYAAHYVRGLQQATGGRSGHLHLKVAACCKHYTAYDLDNWHGVDRFHFNAKVSKQDLDDTFEVPFKACVMEGKAASIMCSYNQVNGIPTCANPNLLLNTVRTQWGLNGYIVTDCDSIAVFYNDQHYTATPEDAVAVALKSGLDLDCGPFLAQYTGSAIQQGKVSISDVDNALANTLTVQMRLGMFNGDPATQPYGNLGPKDVCSPAHQSLALEAARQGIVLLKNHRRALPLRPSTLRSVAVIGPNSDVTTTMIGNYAGNPCGYITPLQGINRYVRTVHQSGCINVSCFGPNQPIDSAVNAASQADAVIILVGLDQSLEAETIDRDNLLLPGRQAELVQKAAAASSRGPVVLALISGGSLDISFARDDPRVSAIVWAGYPGQSGGQAIADVLFGAYNPGGRLPMTWYPQAFADQVPMTEMGMRSDPARGYPGRSYRFYNGPVVYPFGHGLSYSKFSYSIAQAPAIFAVRLNVGSQAAAANSTGSARTVRVNHTQCDDLIMPVHVDVTNLGELDGVHSVLVYSRPPIGSERWVPQRQLVAFEKVHVASGKTIRVKLGVDVCASLSVADNHGTKRILIGDHNFEIGDLAHTVSVQVQREMIPDPV
ncbi:probable beta-D-xylosidase 2 [Dendrobium catenatum]|uniref:Putative beta-D-xylosidase 2 n=1 Tax=Dendrobium catenatum TaxID=906689 RepID=A0A2I0VYG4_9ASPA|nr:probable beta-D-xylosidase 2 [Dendrobium catenatum]PKU68451.1 putative beta-D-xylosidase 2 [Dendrobium catenatum]